LGGYRARSQHCGDVASGHDSAGSNHGHVGRLANRREYRQQGAVVGGDVGEAALAAANLGALHDEQIRAGVFSELGFEHGCDGDRDLDIRPVQPVDGLQGRAAEGETDQMHMG
jgi:hypothetical protein